jgi:hypothetical protein
MTESPTVYNSTIRKARKVHTCGECLTLIEPGKQYEEARGLWDGTWDTHRTCMDCLEIRPDEWVFTMLHEDVSQWDWETEPGTRGREKGEAFWRRRDEGEARIRALRGVP